MTGRCPRAVGDGRAPPLLISHATGFCGHAYAPLAAALGDRFRSHAVDHRGHGATAPPDGWDPARRSTGDAFGDDTLAVARAIDARRTARRLRSLDGRLVAADGCTPRSVASSPASCCSNRSPARRRSSRSTPARGRSSSAPAAAGASSGRSTRRSRTSSGKPPLSAMTAEALRGYVEHGLRPTRRRRRRAVLPARARGGDLRARAATTASGTCCRRSTCPCSSCRGWSSPTSRRRRRRRSPSDSPTASCRARRPGPLRPVQPPQRGRRRISAGGSAPV